MNWSKGLQFPGLLAVNGAAVKSDSSSVALGKCSAERPAVTNSVMLPLFLPWATWSSLHPSSATCTLVASGHAPARQDKGVVLAPGLLARSWGSQEAGAMLGILPL